MSLHPDHDAAAQVWIDQGLARPSKRGENVNFAQITFLAAQANELLYLTGKGALTLDREGKRREPPSPA